MSKPTPASGPHPGPGTADAYRFRMLVESTSDVIYELEPDSTIVYVNPSVRRMLGYEPRDVIGTRAFDYVHPDEVAAIAAAFRATLARQPDIPYSQFRVRNSSGGWCHVEVAGSVVEADPPRLILTVRDVGRRIRAEQRLRESQARLAEAQHVAQLGDFEEDLATGEVTWSDELYRILGMSRTPDRLTRSDIAALIAPEAREDLGARIWGAIQQGRDYELLVPMLHANGGVRTLRIRGRVLRDEAGTPRRVFATAQDVTDDLEREAARAEAERRLSAMASAIDEILWLGDDHGGTVYVSPGFERAFGRFDDPQVARDRWVDCIHPDDRPRVFAAWSNRTSVVQYRVTTTDGRTRWFETHTYAADDHAGGSGWCRASVTRDVTQLREAQDERKQLIESLAQERERLATIFRDSPGFMAVVRGPDHVFELVNRAYVRLIGHRDVIGRPVREAIPEVAGQGYVDLLDGVLATGMPFEASGMPADLVRRPGDVPERRFVNFTFQPLTEADGSRSGVIMQGTDVTDQVRAAEDALQNERRLRAMFVALPIPTFVSRVEGDEQVVIDHNDAALAVSKGGAARQIGSRISDVLKDVPGALEAVRRAVREQRVERWEGEMIFNHSRERRYVVLTAVPVPPDRVVTHVDDVTERRRLEAELRQAQRMEAVGQLAGGIAHDFNNLLQVIKTYTELVLEEVDDTSPFRPDLAEIQKAAGRAAALTRQLLAFSRRQVMQPKVLNLNSLLMDLEPMLRRLIGEDIHVSVKGARDLARIEADPGQLEQIVVNLAVNARDAMPEGGTLTIETSTVELDENYAESPGVVVPGRYVMLAVTDTGVGMDAETKARIFEPFFTTKEVGRGTGLGLSTVYGIVKQSGGYVWCYSEPGQGTTFKVFLPAVDAPVATATGEFEAVLPRGREVVLLVEDEDSVRTLTRRILERLGYTVIEARNGREAMQVADTHGGTIDVLVTDMVMPDGGGTALAKALTELRPELRTLYISGYTDDEIVRRGMLDRNAAFLQKPFSAAALARAMRSVLG